LPIRKTSGLLQIIVGSVPEKYNWVLSLLNMSGSVSGGMADLKEIGDSGSPLAFEGKLLHALVQGFILARSEEGLEEMQEILREHENNRLALFLCASLALKNSSNEVALQRLHELATINQRVPIFYANYLSGEAYLHKADYLSAIAAYRLFIDHQPGLNYIKDAHYKIGLCYWLLGNEDEARDMFQQARNKGKEVTEADKSASKNLAEKGLPNAKLLKVRYLTDGGYYQEAGEVLTSIKSSELAAPKDRAELIYRKARLAHKMGRADATDLYLQTVRISGGETWYFAPNACLQLGYIYQSQNKIKEAEEYFLRALSYRRHEYKNSIDSKARSALAQLGRI
jgi:tetratricopeptide (TPR) repeat protein